MMTKALHTTEVTLVKPLFGVSSIVALLVAALFFGGPVSLWGVLGILLVTAGLFCLYRDRWGNWRCAGPWMVLAGAIVFGANAAIVAVVLARFPHVLAISALFMTGSFLLNFIPAVPLLGQVPWSWRNILILIAMAIVVVVQDLATLQALTLGPSAYVIAVKRTSVLIVAFLGYFFLHERDQSLMRLLLASGCVVLGVATLMLT